MHLTEHWANSSTGNVLVSRVHPQLPLNGTAVIARLKSLRIKGEGNGNGAGLSDHLHHTQGLHLRMWTHGCSHLILYS